jgi:hypothetical protein
VALLAFPMAANLDTGNINLLLTLAVFAAQFTGPRVGGLLWGLATWMKWVPAPLWLVLPPRARLWGLVFLALSGLLSLLMLPLTIIQLQVLFGFGERPLRADYLVFIWAVVPWWWRLRHPFAFLQRAGWAAAWGEQHDRAGRWRRAFRADPGVAARLAVTRAQVLGRRFLGAESSRSVDRRDARREAAKRSVAEIGD